MINITAKKYNKIYKVNKYMFKEEKKLDEGMRKK